MQMVHTSRTIESIYRWLSSTIVITLNENILIKKFHFAVSIFWYWDRQLILMVCHWCDIHATFYSLYVYVTTPMMLRKCIASMHIVTLLIVNLWGKLCYAATLYNPFWNVLAHQPYRWFLTNSVVFVWVEKWKWHGLFYF